MGYNVSLQDLHTLIENGKVLTGIIFVDHFEVLIDMPTKINQDIKFVNIETWKVYEHFLINGKNSINQLGYFNENFGYISITKTSIAERRGDFHGYQIKAMTEMSMPYIMIDLKSEKFDNISQTYDVTQSVKGLFYDIFIVLQEYLNFTATLHKRKDGKWGPTTVLVNGTIVVGGITKSITDGFAEMIVAR